MRGLRNWWWAVLVVVLVAADQITLALGARPALWDPFDAPAAGVVRRTLSDPATAGLGTALLFAVAVVALAGAHWTSGLVRLGAALVGAGVAGNALSRAGLSQLAGGPGRGVGVPNLFFAHLAGGFSVGNLADIFTVAGTAVLLVAGTTALARASRSGASFDWRRARIAATRAVVVAAVVLVAAAAWTIPYSWHARWQSASAGAWQPSQAQLAAYLEVPGQHGAYMAQAVDAITPVTALAVARHDQAAHDDSAAARLAAAKASLLVGDRSAPVLAAEARRVLGR